MSAQKYQTAKSRDLPARPSAGDGYQDGEALLPAGRRLRSVTIVGNSMEPAIRANEPVYYLPTSEIADDGLYVFMLDDVLKVRYLQRYAGGAIQIIPLNPIYEKELLVPAGDAPGMYRSQQSGLTGRFEIIGKVFCPSGFSSPQNGASSMGCTSSGGNCRALSAM